MCGGCGWGMGVVNGGKLNLVKILFLRVGTCLVQGLEWWCGLFCSKWRWEKKILRGWRREWGLGFICAGWGVLRVCSKKDFFFLCNIFIIFDLIPNATSSNPNHHSHFSPIPSFPTSPNRIRHHHYPIHHLTISIITSTQTQGRK